MAYWIDAGRPQRPAPGEEPLEASIVLVGCGGTGSFLAEALGRLLVDRRAALCLVDPDRVGPENVARQAFDRTEVDRFKAEVLARRLARRFGREVGYGVVPYARELHAGIFRAPARLRLLVGAVDNAPARQALAAMLEPGGWAGSVPIPVGAVWWLDAGNGRNSGQLLFGNAVRPDQLRGAFARGRCTALPAPGLQRPDLLTASPEPAPRPRLDCAAAVARREQGPTINQVVAAMAASFIEKLLDGACSWMASYFDLDDGLLRCVPAEPRTVAALAGLHVQAVAPTRRR